ncbi:hypothetical protein Tco_1154797 [Tanacetum coccineum]
MNYVPVCNENLLIEYCSIQGVSKSSKPSHKIKIWIVMPIWKDASPKIVDDAQIEDEDDATEESHNGSNLKENGTADPQVNTARPDINTGSREVSTALPKVNTATPEDLVGPSPASEDSHIEDQEIELGNIPQSYDIPTTPHTRIHKDHPIEHVIGDVQSYVQTRRMKTSYSIKGRKQCRKELLQVKLEKVWILVDLPKGQEPIVTTWVTENKKIKGGLSNHNKARLIVKDITQERSAEASTDDKGDVQITATIDGHSMSITEASLRRHLKWMIKMGAFFTSMGFLIHNILHCLSNKETLGAFRSNNLPLLLALSTGMLGNFSRLHLGFE